MGVHFMMQNNDENPSFFTYREFRTQTTMYSQVPIFSNSLTTKTPKYLHHTSMYGITKVEAERQMYIGNTKNRKVPHYSSELIIDCDNDQTAENVWNKLCKYDYNFELYQLNNYKFFIQRDDSDIPSEHMCYQDKQFVRDNFIDCIVDNKLDLGIYCSPFHLIRGRGAVHEITRAKSKLVEVYKGSNTVSTNDIQVRQYEKPINYDQDTNISDWEQFQLFVSLSNEMGTNKHTLLWKLGMYLVKFFTFTTGLEVGLLYAKSLGYDFIKAERAIRQAYERGCTC